MPTLLTQPAVPTPPPPPLWALLVGIDDYASPDINPLRGCVNDVTAMRDFLLRQVGVPESQIRILTNAQATRERLLGEFETFLINNPALPRDAQILFQFSGHGSQMRSGDPGEADALDETLVPQDSRLAGIFDIPDKTLASLLERLAAAKGENLTVVLDCCHSGSGTRAPRATDAPAVRRVECDFRLPPAELDAPLRQGTATRSAGPSGWAAPTGLQHHVLLAGCRDREESHEHRGPHGGYHGAMTFFLLESLRQLAPGTTYRDLHAEVASRVNAVYRDQMPQCEGQRSRVVFGGGRIERGASLRVIEVVGNLMKFDTGRLVPGLEVGALLEAESGERLEVTAATPDAAEAKLVAGGVTLAVGTRATLVEPVHRGTQRRVRLDSDGRPGSDQAIAALRDALQTATGGLAGPLVLAGAGEAGFDLRVEATAGQLGIFGPDGTALVLPADYAAGTIAQAVTATQHALEAISRFQMIESLNNLDPASRLQGRVHLRLRSHHTDGAPGELPPDALGEGGELTLTFHGADDPRDLFVVEVLNESPVAVYPHVFVLNPDFSIARLYPTQGQENAVVAGRPGAPGVLRIGQPASGEAPLQIYLPDNPRWDSSRDQLLLIATTTPQSGGLELVSQPGLEVPTRSLRGGVPDAFGSFLDAVASGRQTRFAKPQAAAGPVADWGTARLPFGVARATRAVKISGTGQATHDLGSGVSLETPAGFQASLEFSLTPTAAAKRSADAQGGLRLPPGLAQLTGEFQLLTAPGTRAAAAGGISAELTLPEASRQSVTEQNPLRFHLPEDFVAGSAVVFPVVFDGEDYLVTGRSTGQPGEVEVCFLPPPAQTTRGVGRTVKLFFCKQLGRPAPQLGLKRLVKTDAGWQRVLPEPTDFQPRQRLAVCVHGFNSDTDWYLRDLVPWLQEGGGYDHFLTFDYETFGTGVAQNGLELSRALRQECGLKPGTGLQVDVFAHSLGSLVSRAMIELHGGAEIVDRLVMAGPPNHGTPLANATRGLAYLASALVGGLSLPAAGALAWVLAQMHERGAGLADLKVDSEITGKLNDLEKPARLRYLVLAGNHSAAGNDPANGRLERLAAKLLDRSLDVILGEPDNDAVVGVSSMTRVRGLTAGQLTILPVTCNHFDYYADATVRIGMKSWLDK